MRKLSLAAIVLIFLTMLMAFPVFSQRLDLTFGGGDGLFLIDNGTSGGFFSKTYGIRGFPRPDGGITMLTRNEQTFAKPGGVALRSFVQGLDENAAAATAATQITGPISDAAQLPDGKFVTIGTSPSNDWFVTRRNPDRSADPSFNSTGGVLVGFGTSNIDKANNVAIQADGKILVSGTSNNGEITVTVIARFNTNGSFDPTFGPNGDGIVPIYDNGILAEKLVVRSDGKILLAGTFPDSPETATMLYLLNPDGSPASEFGESGLTYLFDLGDDTLADLKALAGGTVLTLATRRYPVSGTTGIFDQDVSMTRIDANGTVDTTFGNGGRVIANTSAATVPGTFEPSGDELARSLLVESSGNIVMAISSRRVVPARNAISGGGYIGRLEKKYLVYLLRYDPDGQLIGQNVSTRSGPDDVQAAYEPIQINGLFEQNGARVVAYGTLSGYQSPVPSPVIGPAAFLTRFSSISALNNANNSFDYNFDGQADFPAYRPAATGFAKWALYRSDTSRAGTYEAKSYDFGLPADVPVPGDYDGDGVQDLAVFRPAAGDWFTGKIYLNDCEPMDCANQVHWGQKGDIPAPGDFDGDGKTDRAIFRPAGGDWYILYSSGGYAGMHFGQNGDLPVPGDYDGDGKSDVAVIRRAGGYTNWYILQSSNNQFVGTAFGTESDKAVPADYNGDGKTEIAVFRTSEGNWFTLSNYADFSYAHWGMNGDIPEPADYDGDRKADFAVFRPSETSHYVLRSHSQTFFAYNSGAASDIPIASVYVR